MKHKVVRFIIIVVAAASFAVSFAQFGNRVKRWNAANYKALEVMMEEMQDV